MRVVLLVAITALARAQEVRVDPRMELLSAIGLLADYDLITRTDTPYRRAMLARFEPWRQHAAVRRFAQVRAQGFSFDAPVFTMACLSNPPELRLQANPADCGGPRIGGDATLRTWVDEVRDFSAVSNFPAFFAGNADLYRQMVDTVTASLQGDSQREVETYYGRRQASYAVMLNPLMTGNYGVRVPAGDGLFHLQISISAIAQAGGVAQFQTGRSLRFLMWHEFSHSFVNPVMEARAYAIINSQQLFEPIRDRMAAMNYANWLTSVNEHVVRAAVARLATANMSETDGAKEILSQRSQGFVYVGDIAERLKEFEAQRDGGVTFEGFGDRLVAVLDELAQRTLPPSYYLPPYAGTINSAVGGANRVVVVPTAEGDAQVQADIRAYAEGIRNRFFPAVPVIDDADALSRDLSQSTVIAYGTLEGNLWLKQNRQAIPLTLEGYKGANLRLIVSFANPANPDMGVAAYTAAAARDVVGINTVFAGPTGYVVADGATVLKAGDYLFVDGRWVVE